jgi:hypothetical protein
LGFVVSTTRNANHGNNKQERETRRGSSANNKAGAEARGKDHQEQANDRPARAPLTTGAATDARADAATHARCARVFDHMAPMGPVQCEKLFLRDPRFPLPVVGDDGGKRLWITKDSLAAIDRIEREGWPDRERIARERAEVRRRVVEERDAKKAAEPPKPRGRPRKKKKPPEELPAVLLAVA